MRFINKGIGIKIRRRGWSTIRIHGGRGMCSWAGGEIEWKRKNVDFLECYSPLPEDQAVEKEGERTEGNRKKAQ